MNEKKITGKILPFSMMPERRASLSHNNSSNNIKFHLPVI